MTIAAFKPDIWSAQLVNDIHLNSVFLDRGLVDTSFSDQTDGTRKVKIPYGNEFGTAQLQDNTGGNISLDKTLQGLTLDLDPNDNQKVFGFEVDDITLAQEKPEILSYYLRQTRVEIVKRINEDIVGAMEAGIRSLSTAPATLPNFSGDKATAKLLVEIGKAKKALQNNGYSPVFAGVTNPSHAELIGLNYMDTGKNATWIPRMDMGVEVIEDHTVTSKNNWPTKGDTRLMPVYILPRGVIFMVIKNVQIEVQRKQKGFGTIVKGKVSWSNAHALPNSVQGAFYPEVPAV